MGELMRRQREAYQLETGADGMAGSPHRTGSTRIVVSATHPLSGTCDFGCAL